MDLHLRNILQAVKTRWEPFFFAVWITFQPSDSSPSHGEPRVFSRKLFPSHPFTSPWLPNISKYAIKLIAMKASLILWPSSFFHHFSIFFQPFPSHRQAIVNRPPTHRQSVRTFSSTSRILHSSSRNSDLKRSFAQESSWQMQRIYFFWELHPTNVEYDGTSSNMMGINNVLLVKK